MECPTAANTAKFVRSIASYGDEISRIIHNYDAIEQPCSSKLSEFLVHLGASIHVLSQVGSLLDGQAALPSGKSSLFSKDGLDYVNLLADEWSVALCRARSMFDGGSIRRRHVREVSNWESSIIFDDNGQKSFNAPPFDETELFRHLTEISWYQRNVSNTLVAVNERLDKLHLLLLLVVQVVTVRDMTTKLPTDCVDLKTIVQYHRRVEQTAHLADITTYGLVKPFRRSRSSSTSYDSDSDSYDSEGDIRIKSKTFRRGPTPPPRSWVPVSPMKEPAQPLPVPQGPQFIRPSQTGVQIVDVSREGSKDTHPPSYTEDDATKEAGPNLTEKSETTSGTASLASATLSSITTVSTTEANSSTKDAPGRSKYETSVNQGRLLDSPTTLGMKFKSLFRSKTSLEAEMKRTLAGDNATLVAYLIHGLDTFQVPHSAFHSLEYTHMRTILSQLQDDTWFKTFTELRDIEHDALSDLTRPRHENDKYYARELVVLKVMHENRLNAWVRVFETCSRVRNFLPRYENGRVVLAILRDKESKENQAELKLGFVNEYQGSCLYPKQRKNPPKMPGPCIEIIDDLLPPPPPPPAGVRLGVPSANTWSGPGGPPAPPAARYRNVVSCQRIDVSPKVPLNEASAREALTTYKGYTFRPVPAHMSPTDGGPPPKPEWTRCFVTRERDPISVLQERIAAFHRRGDSIIDLKMQLTEPQSAQLTLLIDESNRLDNDYRFEHRVREISMVDRERGLVKHQTKALNVDVIHVVLERSLKESLNLSPMAIYEEVNPPIRNLPVPLAMPRGPPIPRCPPIIIEERGRRYNPIRRARCGRRRSISTYYSSSSSDSSNSDSDSDTLLSDQNKSKVKLKVNTTSSKEEKQRWNKDPITVKFDKTDKKRDIVEVLLEQWTSAGDGKKKTELKQSDEKKNKKKKSKKTSTKSSRHYSDFDS